jgi:hypothetical protein
MFRNKLHALAKSGLLTMDDIPWLKLPRFNGTIVILFDYPEQRVAKRLRKNGPPNVNAFIQEIDVNRS